MTTTTPGGPAGREHAPDDPSETVERPIEPAPPRPRAGVLADRRGRLIDMIGPESIALLQGAPAPEGGERFRQHDDIAYLSGVQSPHSYLLLAGAGHRATLYLPLHELAGNGPGEAQRLLDLSGVDAVSPLEELAHELHRIASSGSARRCHVVLQDDRGAGAGGAGAVRTGDGGLAALVESDPWDGRPRRRARLVALLAERLPELELVDLAPALRRLRLVLDESEQAALAHAGGLAALAVVEAMRATRAATVEEELAAVSRFVVETGGGRAGPGTAVSAAWRDIARPVAARLDRRLARGDLVLGEVVAEVGGASARVARVWPVAGRFTPLERLLWRSVMDLRTALLSGLRAGAGAGAVRAGAAAAVRRGLDEGKVPDPAAREALAAMLDDAGALASLHGGPAGDEDGVLHAGMALVVAAQLRIPERELVLACRDTVLVTATGVEVVTGAAAAATGEVEQAMEEPSQLLPYLAARPPWARPPWARPR